LTGKGVAARAVIHEDEGAGDGPMIPGTDGGHPL